MTNTARQQVGGWPLVGWISLGLVVLTGAILVSDGTGEAGLRLVVRTTARTSVILFTGAFIASALVRTWRTAFSRWMLRNRRYLGVSFAVSHALHLAAIVALAATVPSFALQPSAVIGGGLAYVFIAAMTATSFDRTAAWVGPRAWRILHTTGVYYIWLIFFVSYAPRATVAPARYAPFVVLLLSSLGLRAFAQRRRRRVVINASSAADASL